MLRNLGLLSGLLFVGLSVPPALFLLFLAWWLSTAPHHFKLISCISILLNSYKAPNCLGPSSLKVCVYFFHHGGEIPKPQLHFLILWCMLWKKFLPDLKWSKAAQKLPDILSRCWIFVLLTSLIFKFALFSQGHHRRQQGKVIVCVSLWLKLFFPPFASPSR